MKNTTESRSSTTRKVREIPYFDRPNCRAWWLTTISSMREVGTTLAMSAGMKRCMPPMILTCFRMLVR